MPYGFVTLAASIALGIHHIAITDASRRSKAAVLVALVASVVIWWNLYQWHWRVMAIVLQVAVSVYSLVYLRMSATHIEKS